MNNVLNYYKSTLSDGYRAALNKLLNAQGEIPEQEYVPPSFDSVTNHREYSEALRQIYLGLNGLFYEITNINSLDEKAARLAKDNIARIREAIEDLKLRIANTEKLSTTNLTYTDTVLETFNTQTNVEKDNIFYQGGDIPKAFIDTADGMLKLPVTGEFTNVLSDVGVTPSNVFLDKVYGVLVGNGNEVNNAFDRTLSNYWCEVIHSDTPIYATQENVPWLPSTYSGGAACRVRIDFAHTTQISELDIRPYGPHPQTLLGIGYCGNGPNQLTDPTFQSTWESSATPIWTTSTRSYGASGSGAATITLEDNENIVHLVTTASSGACHIIHDMFPISTPYGVEVSADIKTLGDIPIEICMTFYSSGTSGDVSYPVPLKDCIETVRLDSIGWTNVVVTFDVPKLTTHAKLRIGVPPTLSKTANVYITKPKVEPINIIEKYQKLEQRSTVFLPYTINTKRAYLIFSQEHCDYKQYSILKEHSGLSWDRLLRKKYIDPNILSWDRDVRRGETERIFQVPISTEFHNNEVMRPIIGTYNLILDDIERVASGEEVTISSYEYIIGAFEIYLRHREYASRSRFVTTPIKVSGEIREVILRATDNEIVPGDIEYRITATATDAPEQGKALLNTAKYNQEVYTYISTSNLVEYKPTDTFPWVSNSDRFLYLSTDTALEHWLSHMESRQDYLGTAINDIVMFGIRPAHQAGHYIQKEFSSAVDMRSAVALNLKLLYTTLLDSPYLQSQQLKLNISLLNSNQEVVISKDINPLSMIQLGDFWFVRPAQNVHIALTDAAVEERLSIKYLRISIKEPIDSYMMYGNTTPDTNIAALMLSGLSLNVISSAYRTVRFIPADEVNLLSYATVSDFIVPIKRMREVVDGTDRYGRVSLKEYPYLNKLKINTLISTLSSNTSGRVVPYDPNAETPKYLSNSNTISTTTGYRPIKVTLRFKDTGIVARPDTLGKPDPGDIGYIQNEILELANVSQTQVIALENISEEPTGTRTIGTQTVQSRQIKTYETKMKPIVAYSQGVPVVCRWVKLDDPNTTVDIDPAYIKVDAENGLIQIASLPPDNNSIYQVWCDYYYIMGEHSLREPFLFEDSRDDKTREMSKLYIQSYPITRNMTDYMAGTIPTLRKANLDPISSEYYPVFEYYFHPDGYLVFADSFHAYSDTPAEVEIEYDTMGVSPRLSIDFTRSEYTSLTPTVDDFSLLLNVRRG